MACCPSFRMCMASLIRLALFITGWIKEAIHIRKEGQLAMNRDEGSYQLSHTYDRFLDTVSSRRVKNWKN